jgi:acetylornithine deacetylase/succinyl-diaminopimelate desuccinylase-like protein
LLNHTDVVPVERAHWSVDPFAGLIKDGYLWGRGALDMKGMGILELIAVLHLKRRGLRLRRPVRFFAVADEEAGSEYGVEWMDKHHPETMDAAFVINEGGYGSSSYLGVERPLFGLSMAEKSPLWLTLKAKGTPGHGATPHDDNVLDRIVRAMQRVSPGNAAGSDAPVADALRAARAEGYLDLTRTAPPPMRSRLATASCASSSPTRSAPPGLTPASSTTSYPSASAALDCRLVPGYEHERFVYDLGKVIDDPKIPDRDHVRLREPVDRRRL